jgi:hypothetical protein
MPGEQAGQDAPPPPNKAAVVPKKKTAQAPKKGPFW